MLLRFRPADSDTGHRVFKMGDPAEENGLRRGTLEIKYAVVFKKLRVDCDITRRKEMPRGNNSHLVKRNDELWSRRPSSKARQILDTLYFCVSPLIRPRMPSCQSFILEGTLPSIPIFISITICHKNLPQRTVRLIAWRLNPFLPFRREIYFCRVILFSFMENILNNDPRPL